MAKERKPLTEAQKTAKREYRREWAKRRRANDPEYLEKERQKAAEFRRKNPDKIRERNKRAYEKQDVEKRRIKARERARKLRSDPEWRMAHAEKRRSEYAKTDPERLAKIRDRDRCKTYGLKPGEFDSMWASQDGKCKICGEVPVPRKDGGDGRHVDHDHVTGAVRGIVCMRCNRWLIPLENEEWMKSAMAYLGRA